MTCSIQERNENFVNKLGRIHEGKIFGKTEKIILKLILNLIWGVWTWFNWLRIGSMNTLMNIWIP